MRNGVYKIDLDMHAEGNQVQLIARRGDTARRIEARIVDHGIPYRQILPANCRAVMTVKTPEGLTLTNDCDIRADGTVIYDFTVYTVKEIGVDECELTLYDGEGGVLTSPRFTILVDDTVFDKGQTIGAAWEEAIERAKEQILETTDALQNKTRSMPQTFDTVESMQAEDLSEGQITKTRGRWFPNDGGAREYRVVNETEATINPGFDETGIPLGKSVLHPLAIELENGLYALPILTDQVTLLDIGLKRGRIGGEDDIGIRDSDYDLAFSDLTTKIDKELIAEYVFRDESIPAENSRLLQNYIDHIPAMATDPGVCSSEIYGVRKGAADSNMTNADLMQYEGRDDMYAKAGAFNRIFVPAGTWMLRDPVVIRQSVKFFGCATTTPARHNVTSAARPYPVSCFYCPAREITVSVGGGSSLPGYEKNDAGVSYKIVESSNPGEKEIDLTANPPVEPSVFVEHAMFYAAAGQITFKDIEFSTVSFKWNAKSALAGDNTSARPSGDKMGYRPGDDIHDPDEIGKKYNRITTSRTFRGVCGVVCKRPKTDGDGNILVSSAGKVQFNTASIPGLEQSLAMWTQFENCQFDGFSGSALVLGSLGRVRNCQFRANYVGVSIEGHDCWLDWNYLESGFIAIATNSHTTYVNNCYLNNMEAFAVVAGFKVMKRSFKTEYSYPLEKSGSLPRSSMQSWVTDELSLTGSLLGKFNADVVSCSMGAYGSLSIPQGALIEGRISLCGTLYDLEHTRIARQDEFLRLSHFNQAKDAVDGERDTAKAWDPVAETWTKTAEEGDQTLAQYLASASGVKYTALYEAWKNAHIQLLAKDASFIRARFPADMSDADQDIAAAEIAGREEVEDLMLQKLLTWMNAGTLPAQMENPDGTEGAYTLADFGDTNVAAARSSVLAEMDDSETQADENRHENQKKLIGASVISSQIINGLMLIAPVIPRQYSAMKYVYYESGTGTEKTATRVHLAPLYALNCLSTYNSSALNISQNYRFSFQADALLFPGKSVEARRKALYMRPISYQSNANINMMSVPTPFAEEETPFYSLKDSTKTTDSERYDLFTIKMMQAPNGNVSIYVKGDVRTQTGVSQGSLYTPMYHYENGQATTRDLQKPLPDQMFGPHYTGYRPVIYAAPLYAVDNYTEDGVAVRTGDEVGMLLLNYTTKNITVRGIANYSGRFVDIKMGGTW